MLNTKEIDEMYDGILHFKSEMGLGGSVEIRLIEIGSIADIPAIEEYMSHLNCSCKAVRIDSTEDRLFFWIARRGSDDGPIEWGINAIYG